MSKPSPQFTMGEVERILQDVEREREEHRTWFTVRELADRGGVTMDTIRRKLRKLIQVGTVRCVGRRTCRSELTGDVHQTYGYEIVKQEVSDD